MKKVISIFITCCFISLLSCELNDDSSTEDNSFSAVWTRLPGPSGDRTDLAIGGIEGEPENRVYMCEKEGSTVAGLYKGTLFGTTIIWDSEFQLPDSNIEIIDGNLELSYPSISWSIPTVYERGSWAGDCGLLSINGSPQKKLALGLNHNLIPWATITSVTVEGIPVPLQLLNTTTTMPACDSPNGILVFPQPRNYGNDSIGYMITINYSAEGIDGWYSSSSTLFYPENTFETGCNTYQIVQCGCAVAFKIEQM